MQFTTAVLALLTSTALAAPMPAPVTVSAMAATAEWTIDNMQRTCDKADTSCTWSFGINTGEGEAETCSFSVKGSPASQTAASGIKCGAFAVSTGWSGQFGADQGFTTLSIVDWSKKLIVYPAYTDNELGTNGTVVSPNKSYAPANM